ncbi:hypothetical protein [Burkholderia ubonensis]|uniref:hypothetical protein n=1 Tax=Burkholderia ubonensis TaxID=101571 RepID=UPI0007562540|nr:hypothetical protein [Burkholderia ubonensis]KVG22013.1 hypothetical protein WJ29_12300 [Burkholderia ubonensis]KVT88580.1 hypothetical protein WK58_22395 [Burkholderia ubonensis]KWC55386.1 hypothetical protein WL54_25380 [Burkholderia ubonensis]OJA68847.1 hypothetical protein BGV70_07595 [Burkholderia ubonensis]OJA93077.1 hypothetical protein BGV50_22505 [Burkholderia ubonensis]
MYQLRLIATLFIALLLGACAAPMHSSLTPEQRGKITELTAYVVVVQDEVIAAVQPSNVSAALGGGLIGAIIDSKVTNNRVNESQQALGPFYAAIEDVDYRKEFNDSIERGLAGYPIKVGKFTTTTRALSDGKLTQLRNDLQPGQALLIIVPRYALSMDFRSFDSESVVTIWLKPDASDSRMPSQRGVLHYQSTPMGPGGQESLAQWRAQNATALRDVMRESISETVRMVMLDIDVGSTIAVLPQDLKAFVFNTGAGNGEIKGKVLKAGNGQAILLGTDQKLYSLPDPSSVATTAQQ